MKDSGHVGDLKKTYGVMVMMIVMMMMMMLMMMMMVMMMMMMVLVLVLVLLVVVMVMVVVRNVRLGFDWGEIGRRRRNDWDPSVDELFTSSTAQGGGGSFKNRKPIGEVGCCESGMAERSH